MLKKKNTILEELGHFFCYFLIVVTIYLYIVAPIIIIFSSADRATLLGIPVGIYWLIWFLTFVVAMIVIPGDELDKGVEDMLGK